MVRTFFVVMMAFFVVGLVGCSNPQKRQATAEAEIAEEKVKIMRQYNECLQKYEGEKDVSAKCAHYKEASEAFIKK
jgi:cytochrome c biogenesis protein ResB